MQKSDKPRKASKVLKYQSLGHPKEVLKFLEPEAKICNFEAVALELAGYGLSSHPLKSCDKMPILKGWQSQATTDPSLIEQWGEAHPGANVGIATGQPSGVIIMDCDLRHGAQASLDSLQREYGEFPPTWRVMTPGGWHFYFAHPGGRLRSYNSLADGIEIKGEGGNIVGPGSIHPSGLLYRWSPGCSPSEVKLSEAPAWLLEHLKRKGKWTTPGELRLKRNQVNILGPRQGLGRGEGVVGSLDGAAVLSYFSQEWVIKKILPLLGLGETEIGEKFRCVLHPEERASASILRPPESGNPFMYMDFHAREASRRAFPLPLVYYYLKRGKLGEPIVELPKPTFLVWALRLLRDAGVIEGVKVDAPDLPKGVKENVRKVYEGFWDLLSLKFLVAQEASPYTWRFAESWVGVSRKVASGALRWLIGAGYLRFVRHFGSEDAGNKVQLFLMGTRQLVRRLSGWAMPSRGGQTVIIDKVQAEVEAIERENGAAAAVKAAAKLCEKCGEVWEWLNLGELVVCTECYGTLNSS